MKKIIQKKIFNYLLNKKIENFIGVPDSTLKDFTVFLDKRVDSDKHVVTANEGNSIGLATGYHLATGRTPLVYMQNSGFGNSINPLLSLCDKSVYSIPMLILIGWRGAPGTPDEPQHITKGKITTRILKSLGIKYHILKSKNDLKKINKVIGNNTISAVRSGFFWGYAGLINFGIMGYTALGGLAVVLVNVPPVKEAWSAGGLSIIFCIGIIFTIVFSIKYTLKKLEKSIFFMIKHGQIALK